jgi:hypothetical protein
MELEGQIARGRTEAQHPRPPRLAGKAGRRLVGNGGRRCGDREGRSAERAEGVRDGPVEERRRGRHQLEQEGRGPVLLTGCAEKLRESGESVGSGIAGAFSLRA